MFGNICDIAVSCGGVCEYLMGCGTLRVFLRKLGRVRKRPFGSLTSPTFVCARARSKPTSSKLEPCLPLRAKSTSWTSTSWTLASIPAPHEPKTYRFLPHFVAVNSQGRGVGLCYGSMVGSWCGSWVTGFGDRVHPTHKTGFGDREKEHKGISDQKPPKSLSQ